MVSLSQSQNTSQIVSKFANRVTVDRAFVHMDYADWNIPTHLQQDS